MATLVTISGVEMSTAAAANVTETAADVTSDLARLRQGLTVRQLLAECLAGADDDRSAGWRDYVTALEAALARPLSWRTSPVSGATHRVSDGDVGYWVVAPGLTTAQVREAFVAGYEGDPSGAEVYSI